MYRNLFTDPKNKLVKEWNDTSNHQLKMTYTHGAVKPSKHMLLGMGFKSPKKVQEIINLFSHCIEIILQIIKESMQECFHPAKMF